MTLKDIGDGEYAVSIEATKCSREQLIQAQEDDVELHPFNDDAVSEEEVHKHAYYFYI